MQVKDVMTSPSGIKSSQEVNLEESLTNAASLMKENNLSAIKVVDDNGRTVGKITQKEIVSNSDEISDDFFLN